jgi:predicted phage tail protein
VIEPVSAEVSEEESNWLDRLADEVSSTDSTKWLDEAVAEMTADSEEASVKAAPSAAAAATTEEPESDSSDPEVVIAPEEIKDRSAGARGISAPASTTLTTGVYDDIRRLRSKVSE